MIEKQHEVADSVSTVEKELIVSQEENAAEKHAAEGQVSDQSTVDESTSEAMTAEVTTEEVVTEEAMTVEDQQTLRLKIEDKVAKYFQNKDIAKERNEENKLLFEELEEMFEKSGAEEIKVTLPSGEDAVLSPKIREREVLDKDLLADEMQVPKDELKTPFDFCIFTTQGKLTPAMITKHTTVVREIKMKISKRKPKTKRRK